VACYCRFQVDENRQRIGDMLMMS